MAAAVATFLLLASNKVVLAGDAAQCTSDIDAMVAGSPELAQASGDLGDAVTAMMTAMLGATTGGATIDLTILDNYSSACKDAGGAYYLLDDSYFTVELLSSETFLRLCNKGLRCSRSLSNILVLNMRYVKIVF